MKVEYINIGLKNAKIINFKNVEIKIEVNMILILGTEKSFESKDIEWIYLKIN